MRTHKKHIIPLLLVVLFALLSVLPASAAPTLPTLDGAESVYFLNVEHNELIAYKSNGEKIYPASTVKMMTGLVAIELIGDRLDEKVTLTKEMLAGSEGTSMGLRMGENVSYRDLLYGTVCSGFNDAATALAVASAGSVKDFVALMNETAKELGALNTTYTNPTGLDDEAMQTTLADTAIIAKAAIKNELYVTVSSAPSYTVSATNLSPEFKINNRNGLISSHYAYGYYNRTAKGLIAGMTDEGGYCVATFAEIDGLTYLCIVMGASESGDVINSYSIANSLLTFATYYCGELTVLEAGDYICEVPLKYAASSVGKDEEYMLECTVSEDVSLFLPYDRGSLSTLEVKTYLYREEMIAPINEGDVIGGADIYIDGIYRGTVDLCSAQTVKANTFLLFIANAKDFLAGRIFIVALITFIILFGIYLYFSYLNPRRRKTAKIKIDNIY